MSKAATLKSMEAVLDDMKDKNFRLVLDDAKAKVSSTCDLRVAFADMVVVDSRPVYIGSISTANTSSKPLPYGFTNSTSGREGSFSLDSGT